MKKVLIVMGSKSDMEDMSGAKEILDSVGIESEVRIASAHRTPEKAAELSKTAIDKNFGLIIAGAGFAAHLAGAMAANTVLPIIGVPLASSPLTGWDSLLSTAQMPAGIPVATMGIGKSGAKNAGWLAAQILAINDDDLRSKIVNKRKEMQKKVEEADQA